MRPPTIFLAYLFLASNHENTMPVNDFLSTIRGSAFKTPKITISVKSLNFPKTFATKRESDGIVRQNKEKSS